TFEEVAYLLLYGELPNRAQLEPFRARVAAAMTLPPLVRDTLRGVPPGTVPMDALRSAVSLLAGYDPDVEDSSREGNLRKAERLLGQIPFAIAEHYRGTKKLPSVAPRPELGHAGNMLYLLSGKPAAAEDVKAFDVSLILYAEHEFNASTFTA